MKFTIFWGLAVAMLLLVGCNGDGEGPSMADESADDAETFEWIRPVRPITIDDATRLTVGGRIDIHTSTVYETVLSPNSQRLVTIGSDGQLFVWNMASGGSVLQLFENVIQTAYFPANENQVLILDADRQVTLYELNTNAVIATAPAHDLRISASAISPNGGQIAFGGLNGIVHVFDTTTLAKQGEFIAHTGGFEVDALFYSADGTAIWTTGANGDVRQWSAETFARLQQVEFELPAPEFTAISPDHTQFGIARAERLNVYDTQSGERLSSFQLPQIDFITQVDFSPNNEWIAIGGDIDNVLIFDVATGDLVVALQGHGTAFAGLAFSPDSALLLTGRVDGEAYLWNLSDFQGVDPTESAQAVDVQRASITGNLDDFSLGSLAWSSDGQYIILVDRFGPVYMLTLAE